MAGVNDTGVRNQARAAGVVLAVVVGFGLAAAITAAWVSGAAEPSVFSDAGAVVRWGLPLVRVIADLGAALTIGLLILAAFALPVTRPASTARARHPAPHAHRPAMLGACAAAGVWAIATLVITVFTYADIFGLRLDDPDFGAQLAAFVTGIDLGRGLLFTTVVAASVSTAAAGATTLRAAGLLSLLSLLGLIPQALGGHAAGASNHETAVTSLGLHLVGACIWVGGLAGIALLWPGLTAGRAGVGRGAAGEGRKAAVRAVQRFSTLAGAAFVLIAGSGLVNAWLRIGDLAGLTTRYGALVMIKVVALGILGAAGWQHRRRSLTALAAGRSSAFARLVAVELVVMAGAIGVAAVLSRSAPPVAAVPPANPTLAQSVTGYPMPPEPTPLRWLTQWQPDLLWLLVAGLAAGLYLAAVVRLHRRGDRWPVARTVVWLLGVVVLVWATSSGPAVYGRVLFSAHMLGHLTLGMVVPMFLVSGAPVTLALRATSPRHDGTRGAREWIVAITESGYLRVLSHPVVAAVLFAGSLVGFYFSGLFPLALGTHVGHELMHAHFLLVGYLFMGVLIGVDPAPNRPAPPLRMLVLLATMGFHAFFGVTLMTATTVLAPEYFSRLGRPWGDTLLADQQYGGGLAWGLGELPTVIVALILAVQWSRSDDREARRRDRAADRDGDAELNAYNAMLARMGGRGGPTPPR